MSAIDQRNQRLVFGSCSPTFKSAPDQNEDDGDEMDGDGIPGKFTEGSPPHPHPEDVTGFETNPNNLGGTRLSLTTRSPSLERHEGKELGRMRTSTPDMTKLDARSEPKPLENAAELTNDNAQSQKEESETSSPGNDDTQTLTNKATTCQDINTLTKLESNKGSDSSGNDNIEHPNDDRLSCHDKNSRSQQPIGEIAESRTRSDSPSRCLPPYEQSSDGDSHTDSHVDSPRNGFTEFAPPEKQEINTRKNSTNQVIFPNHIHSDDEDSYEGVRCRPHHQARFPIIPNGKSSTHFTRSLLSNKHDNLHAEACSKTNKLSSSDGRDADIAEHASKSPSATAASVAAKRGSPVSCPHSITPSKIKSPAPSSPRSLPGSSKADFALARSQEDAELALVNQLQLPSDVLYLRQQEVNIHGTLNLGWVVCCAIPLPQGSSLGPFQGQLVAPEDVKVGDLIVQFTSKKGQQALMNVAGQSGGWLALLRTPRTLAQRNTHVYWEGGRIWCEIVSDIDMGTELRASFSFQHEEDEVDEEDEEDGVPIARGEPSESLPDRAPVKRKSPCLSPEVVKEKTALTNGNKTTSSSSSSSSSSNSNSMDVNLLRSQLQPLPPHPNQQQPAPGHAALIYGCPFCGVRFSSPRTLQGHLSFYCSKKSSDNQVYTAAGGVRDKGSNQEKLSDNDVPVKQEPEEREAEWERAGIKRRASSTAERFNTDAQLSPCASPPAKISRFHRSPHLVTSKANPLEEEEEDKHGSILTRQKCLHVTDVPARTSTSSQEHAERPTRGILASASHFENERRMNPVLKIPSSETFCKECKIQFSSIRTYKCHKEHYCAQRRKKALTDPSPFAAMFNPPFPFTSDSAAATGIPSALQMSALSQSGLILPREGNQAAAAAAAAAMFLQANMAAMSLPGILMNQRDPLPAQDLPLSGTHTQRPVSPARSAPHRINRGSSPVFSDGNHSQNFSRKVVTTEDERMLPGPMVIPARVHLSKSATPPEDAHIPQMSTESGTHRTQPGHHENSCETSSKAREEQNEDDHPLDLSVAKVEKDQEQRRKRSLSIDQVSQIGERNQRAGSYSSPRSSPNTKSASETQQDINPALSPHSHHSFDPQNRYTTEGATPPKANLRPELLSPRSAQVHLFAQSGHPALILPHPSFLSTSSGAPSSLPPLNLSPHGSHVRQDSPPAMAKNISKCLDCNIVFYKHDNYLIHKKHYCSGKRRPAQASSRSLSPDTPPTQQNSYQRLSPSSDRAKPTFQNPSKHSNVAHTRSSRTSAPRLADDSSSPPRPQLAEIKYKFYCVPCRIKFSNASILEAHKEYYCPAGKDSEHSVILQTSSAETDEPGAQVVSMLSSSGVNEDQRSSDFSPEPQHEEVTCNRCNSVFTSARLLRLHVCDGGFPCPHCDHVAITENRLTEHLKAHAPSRAYRCTICGYRGNTARGMRMHGKSHIDEGLDFTDENMLEYQEPAVMPILSQSAMSSAAGGSGMNTDSELLRLKNEPYKRRRSRKAYEKFDFPLPKVDIPQTCPLCGQNFANSDFLASHFKVHQIAASQYLAGLMKCIHCSYVGKSPEDLRSHFEATHASNHRIHLPQRVGMDQTLEEERQSPAYLLPNGDSRHSSDGDTEGNPTDTQPQTHMVIADPNSPLNEDKFVKNEVDFSDDEKYSPSPERKTREAECQDSPSRLLIKVKEEPADPEEGIPSQCHPVDHFLHMPSSQNLDSRENQLSRPSSVQATTSSDKHLYADSGLTDGAPNPRHNDLKHDIPISAELPMEIFEPEESTRDKSKSPAVPIEAEQKNPDLSANRVSPDISSPSSSAKHISGPEDFKAVTNMERQQEELKAEQNGGRFMKHSMASGVSKSPTSPQQYEASIKQELGESTESRPNFLMSQTSSQSHRDSAVGLPSRSYPRHVVSPKPQTKPPEKDRTSASPSSSPQIVFPQDTSTNTPSLAPSHSRPALFPTQPFLSHSNLPFPYGSPQALPFFFLPTHPTRLPSSGSARHTFPAASHDDRGSRYCQNCDIAFSKQATYLAHKKYYCTARPRGEAQPSATA
ncbi:Zinc finger protein ush [Plakobranchus ocellatus]|uniref:Zinc finger protein ush n=1 Tax=Plakobranchus ocellatus TaxID=259542 RepID=A0AAV3Z3F9_9GAST|nr:Zinc finger protein ush [Plakobranchus ocellatus]